MAKRNQSNTNLNTEWHTLHIFGYGETQLNSDVEKKVATNTLTKVQPLIDFIYGKKPADNNAGVQFHVITFVKNNFGRYVPKNADEKHFHIKYNEVDTKLVEELVTELQAIK